MTDEKGMPLFTAHCTECGERWEKRSGVGLVLTMKRHVKLKHDIAWPTVRLAG